MINDNIIRAFGSNLRGETELLARKFVMIRRVPISSLINPELDMLRVIFVPENIFLRNAKASSPVVPEPSHRHGHQVQEPRET